jgi:peptidoglycan hydrolase-like protein with peptidoglycan-binding domain
LTEVANVSYLRSPVGARSGQSVDGGITRRRFGRGPLLVGGFMLAVVAVVAVGVIVLSSAKASLSSDPTALARIGMPLGGGTIESATVVTGPHSQPVPISVRGDRIWPTKLVGADQQVTVDVTVKRPGWVAWAAGSTQKLHLTLTTPAASLRSHYLTVRSGAAPVLHFKAPISAYSYGLSAHGLKRHVLPSPTSTVTLPRGGIAGTAFVSAAPRGWESARTAMVSWFPAGGAATAVATPAPGTTIRSSTPITLNFSKPVSKVLGTHLPPLSPHTQGGWQRVNSHMIVFRPSGYGYGLGAKVQIALPSGVRLIGGRAGSSSSGGTWSVPGGSITRLQQILALLHYLPLNFKYQGSGVQQTATAEEQAAIKPPAGSFSWRYANTPAALKGFWAPGSLGTVTRGALMAFENDHGLAADGVPGPIVWRALISAVLKDRRSSFGYTFVSVSVASQQLTLWHSGHTVLTTAVNTGIPQAPTATGTYPVYEHLPVTTMSGTNPDGSHYSDPGIPDVSYFNGGDALHGFLRAQYGSPQSLGCVEMPYAEAARVYPYTPIGTLVHVA